jgi:glycosidase
MYIDHQPGKSCFNYKPWKLIALKEVLGRFMEHNQAHNGWDSLYIENHDQPRILGRWADDGKYRVQAAKMLALFHATGRGTLFIYQGQEIGMANPKSWTVEELRDLEEIQFYEERKVRGGDLVDALKQIQRIGRDNSRTPMQWSREENAGFTSGVPWIKVNEDYKEWNVEAQLAQSHDSVLGFWKDLLKLRKEHKDLVHGLFKMLDWGNEEVYSYTRTNDETRYLLVCSFSRKEVVWKCPVETGKIVLCNYPFEGTGEEGEFRLKPFEGRLYQLKM